MECPHCPYEAEALFCAVGLDAAMGMEARREAAIVVNCILAMKKAVCVAGYLSWEEALDISKHPK